MFKVSKLTFKGSKLTLKGSKLLTLHEDRTYPHQFISIVLPELVSTNVEVRTQWMWRFSTKTIVSTNSSSSCFNSDSSALNTKWGSICSRKVPSAVKSGHWKEKTHNCGILQNTRCVWAGGTFFPGMLLCQFLVLAGNRFWFYILTYLEYNTVAVLC